MTDKRGRGVAVAAGAALPSSPGARKAPLGRVEGQVAKAAEAEVEGTGRIRAVSSGRRQEMGGSGKDLRYAQHDALKGKLHACWAVIVRPPYLSRRIFRRSVHGCCRRKWRARYTVPTTVETRRTYRRIVIATYRARNAVCRAR